MIEYQNVILADLLQDKGYIRGPFGSALKRPEMQTEGIPVYEQQHAIYNSREFRFFISEEKFEELKRFQVEANDLVISCSGTVGRVTIIKEEDPKGIISQALLILRVDSKKVLPQYLKYFFTSKEGYNAIVSRSSGSVQVNISKRNVIEQIPLRLPSTNIQKKIVGVLSSIDKKIEKNEQINNNLEEQAQAIFDIMFPSTSNGENTIGDTITPKRGKGLLSKNAVFGDVPVVAGGLEPSTYHNVANTVAPVLAISASGANSGYVSLWNIPIWSSDSSFIDSSMTDDVYFWYVLLKKRQKEIYDAQTGSAQPHIYPQHIAAMPISNLNFDDVRNYTATVTPIFKMIGHNQDENVRLVTTRDTLLPKLMSGELDISDIDF